MNVLSKNMALNEMNRFHAGLIKIKMQICTMRQEAQPQSLTKKFHFPQHLG